MSPVQRAQPIRIRKIRPADRPAVAGILAREWGAPGVVSRGRLHPAHEYDGWIAIRGERIAGLLTHEIRAGRCEIVTLNSFLEGRGIGTRLLSAAARAARAAGCREIWLITTNDNLHALRFYQRRGFLIRCIHAGAIEESRRLKPTIPRIGDDGIPIRDEIELWKPVAAGRENR